MPREGKVQRDDKTGLAGESVSLYCEVDREMCGNVHSMKWSKGFKRLFIYSEDPYVENAEGSFLGRTIFHYSNETKNSTLEVFPMRIEDEGEYSCEITFFNAHEGCAMVQYVNLTIQALPSYPQLSFEDGSRVQNATTVGPFDEAEVLILNCESSGGKPVAQVTWYNGSHPIAGEYSTIMDEDGTGTGTNVLRLPLSRADLGTTLTCEAMNEAMDSPHSAFVTVDVNVPPLSVIASGAESPLHEGEEVTLECVARGARPKAIITWLNGTVPVKDAVTEVNMETDNTYESRSRLQFHATRFENERTFTCEVTNVVLENRNQKPMRREVTLDVRYVPIVKVRPENLTVNESMDVLIFCQYSANPSQLTHVHWYQDLRQVDVAGQPGKYGNGNVDHPSLLIKNTSSSDMGEYTCRVSNEVGASRVINSAYVSVLFRPQVQVVMDRTEPVSEEDRVNVTLICEAVKANPVELVRVRWYLQGELLKELPECDGNASLYGSNSELCDIDPARMLLENVFKDFHGNYSCEGMNEAGWGPRSADAELVVHYAPGPAFINKPSYVKKGTSLELTCNVEDPGRPAASQFRWFRGSHLVPDVTTATWTINPVSLETEDNFTCVPFNVEGEGERATVFIDVQAAPVFIDRLPPYYGALMSAKRVSLSCRVECSPLCSIEWLKNDEPLLNDTHYSISTRRLPPDSSSGDLESVSSELTWRMDRWPGGMLDRDLDNANYTCNSSGNDAGPGVISHTYFRVEYPPEQIVVSETYIQVGEGEIPPKVICNASSYPEPTYVWQHAGQTVSMGAVLNMDYPIKRSRAGEYQCIAENRHGEMKAATNFDVLFKPECKIDREDGGSGEDAHILLICRAAANPEEVAFRWRLLNETLTQDITSEGLESRLRLPATSESLGTYYCYVNNTLGESIPCEIDVTEKLADDNLIVISAIVAAVIVLVIIICVVIIVICRRQRHAGKYPEGSKPPSTGHKDNGVPSSPDDDTNKQTFYENLPFHGMQAPPNKPFKSSLDGGDMEYADVDYATYNYGPIPYKAASVSNAEEKKAEQEAEMKGVPVRPPRKK
ncbi:B-cell receptor CD22-like isoform X4 [Scylla paramamosain]|uniref:B-cell receptor CD22-like isoform X4 n=1 Tax=Scylla paramamosain TaxID=85552 RepID=UPI003082F89F